ncbi:MAG TPA: glycosyltransferase family 2 protein [Urbifossiella sp.]|jgi:glycosyltransferase involved in cell wall biosynthesis|nr:glycosyltransferase family 2 protein [Urbifossiella sp.]
MAQPSPAPRPGVTLVIPAHNAADRLEKMLPAWGAVLARAQRPYEILVVDDGSTDRTPAVMDQMAGGRVHHVRGLRHDTRKGFGAALRTALDQVHQPLLCYASPDYPYTPQDLYGMLARIEVRDEIFGRQADLISGCRTGRRAPLVLRLAGGAWRLFWRVFAGMRLEPPEAWPGVRGRVYGVAAGWVFGVPLVDVNSAFKLFRTDFLKRFPIQADGDFVHTELVAKATFLTSIMDEVPLTPQPDVPVPRADVSWGELVRIFQNPEFTRPDAPAAPPPVEAANAPAPPTPPAEAPPPPPGPA